MVDLAMLQVVRDLVAIFGVIAGLTYYILTVRNQNRTRQAQLLMGLYETYRSPEFRKQQNIIANQEYTDFEDYWEKYGGETNPDSWASWFSVAAFFNGIGVLIKRNLIDIGLVEELLSNITDRAWTNMGPTVLAWRKNIANQKPREYELLHGFEYLYNEMRSRGTI